MSQDVDLSSFEGLVSFQNTPTFVRLMNVRNKIVMLLKGNQFGGTTYLMRLTSLRVLGQSPIPEYNMKPEDKYRVIRIAAENLPNDPESETKSTTYPKLKEQLPTFFWVKDITARNATITVRPAMGGKNCNIEFVSYGQSIQSQAGKQRRFIIADEVCPYDFYEESIPRLLMTNGQFFVGTTPKEAGWMHTELYERARIIYRTKCIRDFLKKQYGVTVPAIEKTDSMKDICVIMAASDDNPMYQVMIDQKKKEIADGFIKKEDFPYETVSDYLDVSYTYDDPDTIAMRRYGIFREITGAVYKQFDWSVHVIPEKKYFTGMIPQDWFHARLIDYHQAVPWAVMWVTLSPEDELFVYADMNPDPKGWTTLGIAKEMAFISGDYEYRLNLIDPLANHTQSNTNKTVVDDLTRIFREMRENGLGTGGRWEPWDTKDTKGQDRVRQRLVNSKICGRPFNNLQKVEGREKRLPTIWIFDTCRETALSLKNWKMDTWVDRDAIITKDQKDKFEQKYSHFCCCLEAIHKDIRFRVRNNEWADMERPRVKQYFHAGMR